MAELLPPASNVERLQRSFREADFSHQRRTGKQGPSSKDFVDMPFRSDLWVCTLFSITFSAPSDGDRTIESCSERTKPD